MDFITDHAGDMFKPGKATVFFRNCTAVLVILYILRRTGIIALHSVFRDDLKANGVIFRWALNLEMIMNVTLIFIAIRVALYIWNYCVIYKYTGELGNPRSSFYKVTPFIWMLQGVAETTSYLFWLLCVISAMTTQDVNTADLIMWIIGVFTFADIGYGNYWSYRQIIERTHLQKEEK